MKLPLWYLPTSFLNSYIAFASMLFLALADAIEYEKPYHALNDFPGVHKFVYHQIRCIIQPKMLVL